MKKQQTPTDDYLAVLFETYDGIDLIATLSALNLEFENQNKNVLTSYATTFGLFNVKSDKPRASKKTLANLINYLNGRRDLKMMVDPSESPFFEYVFLDREYGVFNGINTSNAFYVNSIIEMLLYRNIDLPTPFKEKVIRLIRATLLISDQILDSLQISSEDVQDHKYYENLIMPKNLESFKKAMYFDKSFLNAFVSDEELEKYFLCHLETESYAKHKEEFVPFYYDSPLLDCGEKYLVIDPTSLCYFLKRLCLRLADEFGCKESFVQELNYSIADSSIEKCKRLAGVDSSGAQPIESGFKKTTDYESELYVIGDGKAVLLMCFFFDERYEENGFERIDATIGSCLSSLKESGIALDDVYLIVLSSSPYCDYLAVGSSVALKHNPLFLHCQDINAILSNEKHNPFYLLSFIEFLDYYFSDKGMPTIASVLDLMAILKSKDYDFYLNDETRIKDTMIGTAFDSIYSYGFKTVQLREYSVATIEGLDNPIHLMKYDDDMYFPNPILCRTIGTCALYLRFSQSKGFWFIYSADDKNGLLVARLVAYWINQLKDLFSDKVSSHLYVQIAERKKFNVSRIRNNRCCLFYSIKDMEASDNDDNKLELSMVEGVLSCLGLTDDTVFKRIKDLSTLKGKRITHIIKTDGFPFLTPLSVNLLPMRIDKMSEGILDDKIGEYLVNEKGLMPGTLLDEPSQTINCAVEYLFREFEKYLSNFDWLDSAKLCYLHYEKILRELLIFQGNMENRIALFPEHKNDIDDDFNNVNSASVSLRFVIEYLSTVRPNGKKRMCDFDIQHAINLSSSIIRWAKISDSVVYGLVNNVRLLKSYRFGFDKSLINKFNSLVSQAASFDTSHKIVFETGVENEWPLKEEFNQAYVFEHGFTTDQLMLAIILLDIFGADQKEEIKRASKEELLQALSSNKVDLDEQTFLLILDYLSLNKRKAFYDGTIKPRNLHPWKYNRTHSLLRKPIIKDGEFYMWGPRTLCHSYFFLMQTIHDGKEPSERTGKKSINTINGKILSYSGNAFNDYCFEYLSSSMPSLSFSKNVTSINSKKMENKKGETLGDIDILGIDKEKNRIYLIETKDFFYSRDPSELDIEKKEMFVGNKKHKSFLEKELNRVKWVKAHLDDVVAQYGLKPHNLVVRYTFLTNKPLLSKAFVNEKINTIHLKAIDLKYLRKLGE